MEALLSGIEAESWARGVAEALEGDLVGMLQATQERFGYLPPPLLEALSRVTDVPLVRLHGLATFYGSFSLTPRGRTVVKVCQGTACHVVGAEHITALLSRELGVPPGGTTEDLAHTLEAAACLGCCSLAPVVVVGDQLHGRVEPRGAVALVRAVREP